VWPGVPCTGPRVFLLWVPSMTDAIRGPGPATDDEKPCRGMRGRARIPPPPGLSRTCNRPSADAGRVASADLLSSGQGAPDGDAEATSWKQGPIRQTWLACRRVTTSCALPAGARSGCVTTGTPSGCPVWCRSPVAAALRWSPSGIRVHADPWRWSRYSVIAARGSVLDLPTGHQPTSPVWFAP
jgi:hypothetical protein